MRILTSLRVEAGRILSAFVDLIESVLLRGRRRTRWIAVADEHGGLTVARIVAGQPVPAGEVAGWSEPQRQAMSRAARGRVELRLAPETVVATTLKVPSEALPFVREMIEHRLEKLTPWRPEKLIYGYDIAGRPGADDQYDVQFLATAREIANAAEARLRQALGTGASAIGSAAEPLDKPLRIDLLDGAGDANRRRRRSRIAALAAAFLALSFAGVLWSQWAAANAARDQSDVDARLEDLRRRLVAQTIVDPARRRDKELIQSRNSQTAIFLLIDRLAKAVPDDSVLEELDIQPGSIRIVGISSDASNLVGSLETGMSLKDAKFAAPVTREPNGRDRFDIVVSRGETSDGGPLP